MPSHLLSGGYNPPTPHPDDIVVYPCMILSHYVFGTAVESDAGGSSSAMDLWIENLRDTLATIQLEQAEAEKMGHRGLVSRAGLDDWVRVLNRGEILFKTLIENSASGIVRRHEVESFGNWYFSLGDVLDRSKERIRVLDRVLESH
jgi:hypothetical protein